MRKSLAETCGQPFELLVWDNTKEKKPITEVYNLLGNQARNPYLCFLHEDILFETNNWGQHVIDAFQADAGLGLIGVAGSRYKSRTPSGWSTGFRDWDCMNILHKNKSGVTEHLRFQPGITDSEQVVNIDGVFMFIRREVWEEVKFDDQLLRGFHLYDIDFSFRVTKSFRAAVLFNIDILHLTEGGNFGDEWLDYTLRWHEKYRNELPVHLDDSSRALARESKIRRNWLHRLTMEKISAKNKWRWIRETNAWGDPKAWPYIVQFLAGRKLRKKGVLLTGLAARFRGTGRRPS